MKTSIISGQVCTHSQRLFNDRLARALGAGKFSRTEILEKCNRPEFGLTGIATYSRVPDTFLRDTRVCEWVGWGRYRIMPPQDSSTTNDATIGTHHTHT